MAEFRSETYEEKSGISADHPLDGSNQFRSRELAGRQSLVELVHQGVVRLHGEDEATVDLWQPEQLGDGAYRVRLGVNFSDGMRERYNIAEKPLPDNPTCVIHDYSAVEVGDPNHGGKSFSVDGWDLYNSQGERIRHHNRTFVLRDLSKIELLVPDTDSATAADSAVRFLGSGAMLGENDFASENQIRA